MGDVIDATGYKGAQDASGAGGRSRMRAVDRAVDGPASTASAGTEKSHPSTSHISLPYSPTATEKATKTYGAPTGAPLLSGGG